MRLNNAKYNNTYRLMFNNSKLERAQKQRVSQRSDETESGPSKFTRCSIDTVSVYITYIFSVKEMSLDPKERV